MFNRKMEQVRQQLNEMIISDCIDRDKLLEKSKELDLLILQSMKAQKLLGMGRMMLGDEIMRELESLLEKLKVFEKMYQAMRIVDPVEKKVLELKGSELHELNVTCYEFWKQQKVCDNCISMRAFNEDDTIFKIEYKEDSIYMVTAIPVKINERKFVVEFLKNTTNSLMLGDGTNGNSTQIITMVEYINQIAVRDALTEQFNRRYINERLPIELLNASIKNEPLSIIFSDLDFFKKINDTYGHHIGDLVLKEFGKELQKLIRSGSDWLARYGGEEFLICLTNTEHEKAINIAERMRKKIEDKKFLIDGQTIHITCSFGVYTVCRGEYLSVDRVIELADKKLYQAKRQGRNRVV